MVSFNESKVKSIRKKAEKYSIKRSIEREAHIKIIMSSLPKFYIDEYNKRNISIYSKKLRRFLIHDEIEGNIIAKYSVAMTIKKCKKIFNNSLCTLYKLS